MATLQRSGSAVLASIAPAKLCHSSSTGGLVNRRKQQPLDDHLFEDQKAWSLIEGGALRNDVNSTLNGGSSPCGSGSPSHRMRRMAGRRPTRFHSVTSGGLCVGDSPTNRRSAAARGSMLRESSVGSSSSIGSRFPFDSEPKAGVSFRQRVSMHPVEPYRDLYGMHPDFFNFGRKGEMQLTNEGIAQQMRDPESMKMA